MTSNPADFPLGTILRHSESGRLAVRFQQDDTTGKGMHAWYVPASNPAEARALHHVEVRGWELVELPAGVDEVVAVLLDRLAAEYARAVEDWTGNDERVLAENQRLANENLRLAEELAGMADMGRKARDHYTEQIETLQRAILDVAGYPANVQWPGNRKAIGDLRAEADRLTRERDEAQQSLEAARREISDYERQYAELWRDANTERAQFDRVLTHLIPAARQVNGTISGLVLREQAGDLVKKLITDLRARPAIPADAERASWANCMGIQDFEHKLADVPTAGEWSSVSVRIGSQYFPVTGVEPAENEWTGEESVAIVAAIPAPVSGSDTTADGPA